MGLVKGETFKISITQVSFYIEVFKFQTYRFVDEENSIRKPILYEVICSLLDSLEDELLERVKKSLNLTDGESNVHH